MAEPEFQQLMGIVEVDETYIGGSDRNRHWDKKTHKTGGEASGKTAGHRRYQPEGQCGLPR